MGQFDSRSQRVGWLRSVNGQGRGNTQAAPPQPMRVVLTARHPCCLSRLPTRAPTPRSTAWASPAPRLASPIGLLALAGAAGLPTDGRLPDDGLLSMPEPPAARAHADASAPAPPLAPASLPPSCGWRCVCGVHACGDRPSTSCAGPAPLGVLLGSPPPAGPCIGCKRSPTVPKLPCCSAPCSGWLPPALPLPPPPLLPWLVTGTGSCCAGGAPWCCLLPTGFMIAGGWFVAVLPEGGGTPCVLSSCPGLGGCCCVACWPPAPGSAARVLVGVSGVAPGPAVTC